MLAYVYKESGKFELEEREKPKLLSPKDAIVRVTLASICSSDLHIKHGAVPRAVPGITVGQRIDHWGRSGGNLHAFVRNVKASEEDLLVRSRSGADRFCEGALSGGYRH